VRSIRHSIRLFAWANAALLLAAGAVHAGDRVYPTPDAVEPLAPGTSVPPVRVESVRGAAVDLAEVMGDEGALLVFYRGGW
jgi:hypothetical protein